MPHWKSLLDCPGMQLPFVSGLLSKVIVIFCITCPRYADARGISGSDADILPAAGASQVAADAIRSLVNATDDQRRNTSLTFARDDAAPLSTSGSLLSPYSAWSGNASTTVPLTVHLPFSGADQAAPPRPNMTVTASPSTVQQRKNGSNCYFPSEYQGIYQVQSSIDPQGRVQYDQVEIGPQDISVWGTCHSLVGQHVLLHIGGEAGDCFRCIHLSMKTPSVLQVFPEGLQDKCYTNEEAARSKCPQLASLRPGDGIFLWRKSGSIEPATLVTGQNIYRTLCPLEGEFTFKYYLNGRPLCETGNAPVNILDGPEWSTNTPQQPHNAAAPTISQRSAANLEQSDFEQPLSFISTCPSRDILHATFRTCDITDRETNFKCLGTWPGEDGQSYIGLMDFYDDSYAKYRCALFKEEKIHSVTNGVPLTSSVFHVSLSPDSSCNNELYNATVGYETLSLFPVQKFNKRKIKAKLWELKRRLAMENSLSSGNDEHGTNKPLGRLLFAGGKNPMFGRPPKYGMDNMEENVTCRFPEWMQGNWQYFSVQNDDLYTKEALDSADAYMYSDTGKQRYLCVGRDVKAFGQDERIVLYSQTSCGEESIACLWVRKKGTGTMEFRKGHPIPFADATVLKRHTGVATDGASGPSVFPPFDVCEESFFLGSAWNTQINLDSGVDEKTETSTCPFSGELEAYMGNGEKCTAFSSHCGTPDVFEYKLRTCKQNSNPKDVVIYDERHFRCVSTWNSNGYILFLTELLKPEDLESSVLSAPRRNNSRSSNFGSNNIQTQCFVMKALPDEHGYVIASLNSNCRHVSVEESEWDQLLSQSGLRFTLTANCSSSPASQMNVLSNDTASNEIPSTLYGLYHPPKLRHNGWNNETDDDFNAISNAITKSASSSSSIFQNSQRAAWLLAVFVLTVICVRKDFIYL